MLTTLPKCNVDKQQLDFLKEQCIVVNKDDNIIGSESKEACHLAENIKKGMLHRAFSVFLFNDKDELLMQQRSDYKVTFPGLLTNTCCSHPLYNAQENTVDVIIGLKHAAVRKLKHELGIEINESDLKYKARFYYKALSDDKWGEHEIDYIFLVRKNISLNLNPNEVKMARYFSLAEMWNILRDNKKEGYAISPWFELIAQNFLFKWWTTLSQNLKDETSLGPIHKF